MRYAAPGESLDRRFAGPTTMTPFGAIFLPGGVVEVPYLSFQVSPGENLDLASWIGNDGVLWRILLGGIVLEFLSMLNVHYIGWICCNCFVGHMLQAVVIRAGGGCKRHGGRWWLW